MPENNNLDSSEFVGECPKCGSTSLTYGVLEPQDDEIYYPFTCDDCGCKGKEWYALRFVQTTVDGEEA